jgi:HSP20 family protein
MAEQALAPAKPRPQGTVFEQFLEPFSRLRNEIDRAFDEFPVRFPAFSVPAQLAALMPAPAVEMTETDKAYKVSVEVPGIPAAEIEVEAERGMLVIKGEKKEEREEKERDYTRSERSYGAFERRVALPQDAKLEEISAMACNGVLKITVPRDHNATSVRRKIEIESARKS